MFDNLPGSIWLDGDVVPWRDARLHVMTHALHYASSVYEGLRVYNSKVFKAREHYDRLHQSAQYLDFKIPYPTEHLVAATDALIKGDAYKEAYVRAISWCGSKKMTVSHRDADIHTAIGMWERPITYPPSHYTDGIRMNIADWRRPNPKTAPVHSKASGLYMISSMSKRASELLGFDDALMLDHEEYLSEATSSNIFVVIDGALYTPKPDCFLNGITRLTCIDLARELGIKVYETKLTLDDLAKAQEVFLTGTAIEILPVGSIEGQGSVWRFQPGKITHAIRSAFQTITHNL